MHQTYLERKLSQPSTSSTSRSLTPKPFARMPDERIKSPERLSSEFSHLSGQSLTVSSQKNRNNIGPFGSSSKMSIKVKEQMLNTDRLRNRNNPTYCYNPKNTNNIAADLMKAKTSRNNYVVTKTEPAGELESTYALQVNKLLQKINSLKYELEQSQEREVQYLAKLSNLENENKSLQLVIEDKEKKMQEIVQKSKEDKVRMYQFLTELETYKQANANQQGQDDTTAPGSTMRLSDICDSTKKIEKVFSVEKGLHTGDRVDFVANCQKCESITNYCEHLMNKLCEVDQASRCLLKEHNLMKESLTKAKKAEIDFLKARNEIEQRAIEIQGDFDKQAQIYDEIVAENIAFRTTLKETMDSSKSVTNQECQRPSQLMFKKGNSQQQAYPLPASFKALIGAQKILKAGN